MIEVTPQVQERIDAGDPPIELVRVDFAGTPPIFVTTAGHDIPWDGETWLANGFLLDLQGYDRVNELRTKESAIGFTGVDLSIAAILLNQSQVGRQVVIYNAWLNASGGVIPDPAVRDELFIDDYEIKQGTTSADVILTLSDEWADFKVKKGIRTTDASLQRFREGDRLFRYSKDVKSETKWGGV